MTSVSSQCLTEPVPNFPRWTCYCPKLSPSVMLVLSLITITRKGKKSCGAAMREEWGGEERNNSVDTKMKKEGEEELAVKKIPFSLWRRPEESCPPSAHGEPRWNRFPLCSQGRAHATAMLELWRRLQPTDSPWKWHRSSGILGWPQPLFLIPFAAWEGR